MPPSECFGIDYSYIAERTIKDVITNDFCCNAVQQLPKNSYSVARRYNGGTPEEVDVGISWENKQDFEPTSNDCLRFLNRVIDDCDGSFDNPMNWKGGGFIQEDGVTYHIYLPNQRPPDRLDITSTKSTHTIMILQWEEVAGHVLTLGRS